MPLQTQSLTHSLVHALVFHPPSSVAWLFYNIIIPRKGRANDRADGHREDNNKTETSTSVSSVPPPVHLPTQTMRNLPLLLLQWLVSFYYSATSQNTRILLAFLRHAITTTTTHTTLARCAVHAAAAWWWHSCVLYVNEDHIQLPDKRGRGWITIDDRGW